MREILIICVSFLFLNKVQGQGSNCYLEGVTPEDWISRYRNKPMDDNVEEFKTFKYKNIKDVKITGDDYGKYFTKKLNPDDKTLSILANTDEFKYFEKNEVSSDGFGMTIFLIFECEDDQGAFLTFYQPINDLNTFDPEFKAPSYSYQLPMPLSEGINLACFGDINIEACDYDISNMGLTFTIDPPGDFSIEWERVIDEKKKCHRAKITSTGERLTENKEYDLTVTDQGEPEKSGTAKLFIEIDQVTSIPPNPHFEEAYYTANYNVDDDEHTFDIIGDIRLDREYSDIKLELQGEHKDYFEVSRNLKEINVKLNDGEQLPEEVLKEAFVVLTIEATLEKADRPGRTVLVIQLPKEECPQTTTPGPTTVCPTTETPTECPICPETTTPMDCPTTPTERPSTTDPGTTTVCPTTEAPTECPVCPETTTPMDCPTTSTERPSTTDPETPTECPVCPETTTPMDCPISPTECPSTTDPDPTTVFPTTETPTECPICPETTTPMDCPIAPTECPPTPEPGTCTPPPECPTSCPPTECSTPEISTSCPPCVTTPEPPIRSIRFELENYWLDAKYNFVGFIGVVRAIAIPAEGIEYSIEVVGSGEVPDVLKYDKDTGALTITGEWAVGEYKFIATAKGADSKLEAQTSVVINVCSDCGELKTTNSLIVKHVAENSEGYFDDLCDGEGKACTFEVTGQYPSTNPWLFDFREGRLHYDSLDREMPEVKELAVPQFIVSLQLTRSSTIRLSNASHLISKRSTLYADENREWVYLPENLIISPHQLLLSVIIDDINDNPPKFDEDDKLIIGYPIKDLATQIAPPYLAKVHATDLDVGINAKIKYSTTSPYFSVHPETGVIYPAENAFDDGSSLKFVVEARDMDGDPNGKSAELEIEVKLLEEEHLAVFMARNLMLEDVDNKLKDLSEKTGIQLKYLTAAVVPGSSSSEQGSFIRKLAFVESSLSPRASSDHLTKIVVYGLNNKDEPVQTDELKEELEESGELEGIEIDKWNPTPCPPATSSTTEITTSCPPCVTTPEPPIEPSIKFELENYWLDAKYKYIGFIGVVRAISIPAETVEYSIEGVKSGEVPDVLKYDKDTGALTITGEWAVGEYKFIATAKGADSKLEAQTSVIINVCTDCGELKTTNSLIVKHVPENSEGYFDDLCDVEGKACTFEVTGQYPSTNPWLFNFREGRLHYASLDRQMTEVKDLAVPQFVVSLHLTRPSASRLNNVSHLISKRNALYADEVRECVYLPETLIISPHQLLLSVIIEDINDNPPKFDEGDKLIIGYPIKNLATQIAPPYLAKVHATDLDVGINAQIKYSTTSPYFSVHPETGVIYPAKNAFDDSSNLKFVVEARDMDGDPNGKSANLDIEVKLLEEDHLAVLMVKNLVLEDVDNKLKELSEKTDIELKYLTAAVVPDSSSSKQSPRASYDHSTKIVVYGLDNEDEPVQTDELKEELEESGGLQGIEIDKWNPPPGDGGDCGSDNDDSDECSTVGYIVAVSVLAVLLVIFIIAAAAFYYFKIYRTGKAETYKTMDEEDAGSIEYEKTKFDPMSASEDIPQRRATGFVFNAPPPEEDEEEDEDEYGEKPKYESPVDLYTTMVNTEENKGVYTVPVNYSPNAVNQQTLGVEQETNKSVEEDLINYSPPSDYTEYKKSVSFKPTVEKINIVVEDEKQDDDILDERL